MMWSLFKQTPRGPDFRSSRCAARHFATKMNDVLLAI
jgi:hypothetical protein